MKLRLTDENIGAMAAAPPGKRIEIFDTALPGLVVRITDLGKKSFGIRYRCDGATLRYTIGKTPPLRLKKAREIAYGLLAGTRQGQNPMADKRAAKRARNASPSVQRAVERFCEKGLTDTKPAHASEVARLLRKEIASRWKNRTLASIEAADVAGLLDDIRAPGTKRSTYFALRKLLRWATGVGIISASPIGKDFPNPAIPASRERVLEANELRVVWQTVTGSYSTFNSIVQLLITTGQRRDEVAEAEWKEFDFEQRIWTIPAHRTKIGKKAHRLPLTDLTIQILKNIPRDVSPYLFPGEGAKRNTFSAWSRSKRRLNEKCGVHDWRLHDLRRTLTTRLAEKGVAPHVVERIIDHRDGEISGAAATYNRASYEKEMRDALKKWDGYLSFLHITTSNPCNERALRLLEGSKGGPPFSETIVKLRARHSAGSTKVSRERLE